MWLTWHSFLSVCGLNYTCAFPFNSKSVSTSSQSNTYIMLKACTLCMHAVLNIVFSCRSYNYSCSIFFCFEHILSDSFEMEFEKLKWTRAVIYFCKCWFFTHRLHHTWYSPLKQGFQGSQKTLLPVFSAVKFSTIQVWFEQLNLHQLCCLLFFFILGGVS